MFFKNVFYSNWANKWNVPIFGIPFHKFSAVL